MQQLPLFFAMALLYIFQVTIPPIIRSTYAVYGLSGRQVYLCCNFFQYYGSLIVVGRVEL